MPSTRVAATFHPSSSVLASTTCSLSSRNLRHLVVGKLDRLEVYSIRPDKLELECTYQLTGKLSTLKAIPVSQHRCNILVLLDHPDPATLFLSYLEPSESDRARLVLISREDLYERGIRPAEFFMNVVVHPNGKVAIVSCYTRRLKVILISEGAPESYNDIQVPEISNILDIAFLPINPLSDIYTLSILLQDHKLNFQLVSRDLSAGSSAVDLLDASESLRPTAIPKSILPYLSSDCLPKLVALYPQKTDPKFLGGILVIGGRKIALYECEPRPDSFVKGKRKRSIKEPERHDGSGNKSTGTDLKDRKPIAVLQWPWGDVSAAAPIDSAGERILIGDRFGRFSILSTASVNADGLILIPLGETSSPTTISYLDNQVVFIGSHHGDSQVIKIHAQSISSDDKPTLEIPPRVGTVPKGALEKGKGRAIDEDDDVFTNGRVVSNRGAYLTVLQTFKNIAPILDAVLTDVDGSGQPQIVTCSGGANTGSVNVVRMGADFDELAAVTGLENVTNVWPIRTSFRSLTHSHIVVSTLDETHIFRITSGETLSRVEAVNSFVLDEATICVKNVAQRGSTGYQDSLLVVQVTDAAAHLLEYDPASDQWWERDTLRDDSINVAASINPSQILIARKGGKLMGYTLEVQGHIKKFKPVLQSQLEYWDGNPKEGDPNHVQRHDWRLSEISAVSVNPMNETAFFTNHVAVAFWQTHQIKIYAYKDTGFSFVSQSPPLPAPVRSLLFYNFGTDANTSGQDHRPCLVAGLSNGLVVSFSCIGKGKELKDMKVISLGDSAVSLSPCQIDGRRTVLACGNKSAILAWDKSRLQHSPVLLKDINSVHHFNSDRYPNSIILGTSSGIHIGRVQNIHKMHVRGISLGFQTPRKIVHLPALKVFGVVTERNEPVGAGDDDQMSSEFLILDDTTFEVLSRFTCYHDEFAMSLTTMTCTFVEPDETRSFFCLGTAVINPSDLEPKEGRIVILGTNSASSSNLSLADHVKLRVNGGVYSMGVINGLLAAAVNSSVILYRLEREPLGFRLQKLAEWNHTYVMANIVITGEHLVAADYLQSVSLLKLVDNSKFATIARDYSPLNPIAVSTFDERKIIGADHNLNLFSFSLHQEGNRKFLKRDGHYHVGEVVSKFLPGSIVPTSTEKRMQPTHIFCTNTGRIGVIVDVSDASLATELSLLEIGLAALHTEESHAKYRAPRMSLGRSDADEPAYGFIDGDFLEQLLPLVEDASNHDQVRKVFATSIDSSRIRSGKEEIYEALENLRNMH
ncbi:hypothetical protein E1B28_012575 [Marasmius oreades]|uniref:DNA damage-binding protein 1 n=1 Tax=Marasmius oreades TaxID=181124 RepID=A0A9P7RRR8_9AGAR|nr:uncharacterized protein E1B28_012575 [Marasmius oreades]KAG7088601.1 hypothetical protein E1B28_012575 [Marasmius oreades]